MPRALVAPDTDHPTGTVSHQHRDMSALQQRAAGAAHFCSRFALRHSDHGFPGRWNNADATRLGVASSRGRKWLKEPGLACYLSFDSVGKKVYNNIISIPICFFPHS
ncbi:hypothetical protein ACFX19_041341 [Malus domestica]